MVVTDFHRYANTILVTFSEFQAISCLKLNLPKTVLVPLWKSEVGQIRRMLQDMYPNWARVDVSYASRYLGFMLGPEAGETGWNKATCKFEQRCRSWSTLRLGLQYDVRVYKVFCFSVLGFLWQLMPLPSNWDRLEQWALRKFAPGPGNWATPMDLFCLKAWYGSHFAFPSMRLTALAAKLRVFRLEDGDFLARKADLLEGIAFGEHRCAEWREWYWSCLSMVLCDSSQEASALGVSSRAVDTRIQSMHPSATASVRRKLYQKTAYAMLLPVQSDNPENRMRHKLTRWNLSDPIGIVTRRALRRLSNAFRLTTPRVAIVLFRSLWNGWCTARRFQERGAVFSGVRAKLKTALNTTLSALCRFPSLGIGCTFLLSTQPQCSPSSSWATTLTTRCKRCCC